MAEINLLHNQEVETKQKITARVFNNSGIILLILVIAVYVVFFYLDKQEASKVTADASQQQKVQQEIVADPQYPILLEQQQKVSDLQKILDQHLSWGDLIQKFGDATLKTASYTKLIANSQGGATITGIVPDFQNLDKLIKGYQLNNFNYIKDVKLVNIALSDKDQIGIQFTIKLTFNQDMLLNIGK